MRKLGIVREQGAKLIRSRPTELPDSPAEFSGDRQVSPLDGAEGTIERTLSQVGTA
jgi:hypothetical protein